MQYKFFKLSRHCPTEAACCTMENTRLHLQASLRTSITYVKQQEAEVNRCPWRGAQSSGHLREHNGEVNSRRAGMRLMQSLFTDAPTKKREGRSRAGGHWSIASPAGNYALAFC